MEVAGSRARKQVEYASAFGKDGCAGECVCSYVPMCLSEHAWVTAHVGVRGQPWETFFRYHLPCCWSQSIFLEPGSPLRVVLAGQYSQRISLPLISAEI